MFPAGLPGFALLVLRNCIAVALAGSASLEGWPHTALLILLGMLIVGMFTPVVCGLASAFVVFGLVCSPHQDYSRVAIVVLSALSLACIGPGALSVDARIFGRRLLISTSSSFPADEQQ